MEELERTIERSRVEEERLHKEVCCCRVTELGEPLDAESLNCSL